jgi:hypothetical protein
MEQLQLLHARMDDQARTQSELLRRDALRDHPAAIDSGANPHVDGPYRPIGAFVPAHVHEPTHSSTASRRHTIDPEFVAMTADWGNNFDGDSFSRSFRLEAPLMPKTGELKTWKRDFLSFLSIKGGCADPSAGSVLLRCSSESNRSAVRARYARSVLQTL